MKKIPGKLWTYAIIFLIRATIFNVALGFAITALVFVSEGMTIWAILSIAFSGAWLLINITNHLIWSTLTNNQRALYFGIRRHGAEVVKVADAEVKKRSGQNDILEIMRDTDGSLEIQMMVNGAATFVNVFIGVKWIHFGLKFNKNSDVFKYEVVKGDI